MVGENKIKGIEFALLAVGALAGVFLRYKLVSIPMWLGALPLNVLMINVAGSFILGVFSIGSVMWNLDGKYSLLVAIGFCGSFIIRFYFPILEFEDFFELLLATPFRRRVIDRS